MKKVIFEEFIERVQARHGDNFTISRSDYVSVTQPLTIVCNTHKIPIQLKQACQVTNANPCNKCVRYQKFKNYRHKVLNSMQKNYPQFELISDIIDFNCEATICCSKHGEINTKTDQIIFNRMGCFKCARETTGIKNTGKVRVDFEIFKTRFKKRYGSKLSLLSDESDYQNTNSILTVQCSDPSHSEFQSAAKNLLRYQGCKNCNESWGERLVRLALEELAIKYEQEKRFASCRDKKELPFDFWLPTFSTLIEFQGKQHEVSTDRFGGSKALKGTQQRDKIKKDWATDNGINLIYVHDYTKVKETILKSLIPTDDFNPKLVLEKVLNSDKEWSSQKWSEYLQKLNKKHKGRYDFSKSSWSWGQSKISYICSEHGTRNSYLQSLLKGHGCSLCANNEMTLEKVVERSVNQFGYQFNFSNSIFKGMSIQMEIICKKHGVICITPEQHLRFTKGCRECGGKAKDFSSDNFIKKAHSKFSNRFDYSELIYLGALEKVTIRCKSHNLVFKTLPNDHIRNGTGCCPKCVKETKSRARSQPVTVRGLEYPSFSAAAAHYGLQPTTVHGRIRMGWNIDKAFTTQKK